MRDTYELDTWGQQIGSTGSTPNPYRFGGAWGYITDPSGMLQLGARYYWPEIGRFISQDPIGEGGNWYAYVGSNPVVRRDPTGLMTRQECLSWCYEDWLDDLDDCLYQSIFGLTMCQGFWLTGPAAWYAVPACALAVLAYDDVCNRQAERDYWKCVGRCPCE